MTIHDASTMLLAKALGLAELTQHEDEIARATLSRGVLELRFRLATEELDAARTAVASANIDHLERPLQGLRMAIGRRQAMVDMIRRRTGGHAPSKTPPPATARDEEEP